MMIYVFTLLVRNNVPLSELNKLQLVIVILVKNEYNKKYVSTSISAANKYISYIL